LHHLPHFQCGALGQLGDRSSPIVSAVGETPWFCTRRPPGIRISDYPLPQGVALDMCLLIGFLLFTALLFGLGFALHVLWWIALIFLIFWIIGLAFRPRGGRWYYW
jgi:hypothetical protein